MNLLKKVDQAVAKFFAAVCKVYECVSIVAMVGIMLALMTQTVLQWFSISILWSDEIVSVMNIWLVFMAATVVEHEKKHVQVDFIVNALPSKVQNILQILIYGLSIFALSVVFKGGVTFIQRTTNMATNILRLPMAVLYFAPLLGLGLMILMHAYRAVHEVLILLGLRKPETKEEGIA